MAVGRRPNETTSLLFKLRCGQRPWASHVTFKFFVPLILNIVMRNSPQKTPETLDTACYTAIRNRKGIDHRTNTTVSRPGQFRVALRIVWSSPAGGFFSRVTDGPVGTANLPVQSRTPRCRKLDRAAPARRGASIRACRVAIRGDIAPARVSAPSSVQPNC